MEILTGNDKDKYTISDKPKHVVPVYKGKVRNISTVTQYCSYAAYKFNSCTDTSIQWNIIKGIEDTATVLEELGIMKIKIRQRNGGGSNQCAGE